MYGGGTFTAMNKVLPGAYINFVSAAKAVAALSDRGRATMAMELDWGPTGEVITVTNEDFIKNTQKIFGYAYSDSAMSALRDLFMNATVLYLYRLNGAGNKASNDFCTAKYAGTRGNNLKVVIAANVDVEDGYDVKLYLDEELLSTQTVTSMADLEDNDFVTWNSSATLAENSGTALAGGTNSTVTGADHSAYLTAVEPYAYNAMGVMSEDTTVKKLYASFAKRMRDEVGVKFQLIVYAYPADHESTINVKNCSAVIPWVVGAEAGCNIASTISNRVYDGEAELSADYSQSQLIASIEAGEFVFHKVGDEIRVLTDINSLVNTTATKGDDFKSNQTIRVIDQIANDIASTFNDYYEGKVQNNAAGRIAFWNDIVKHHKELNRIGAIEGFSESDIEVSAHETDKKAVVVTDGIVPVNAMEKLYMTVTVS